MLETQSEDGASSTVPWSNESNRRRPASYIYDVCIREAVDDACRRELAYQTRIISSEYNRFT